MQTAQVIHQRCSTFNIPVPELPSTLHPVDISQPLNILLFQEFHVYSSPSLPFHI